MNPSSMPLVTGPSLRAEASGNAQRDPVEILGLLQVHVVEVEGEQVAAREHVRPVLGHRGKLDRLEEIRELLPVATIPLHPGRYLLTVACSRVVRPAAAGGREAHDKDGADESSETGLTGLWASTIPTSS
jgi:hypothetical protein